MDATNVTRRRFLKTSALTITALSLPITTQTQAPQQPGTSSKYKGRDLLSWSEYPFNRANLSSFALEGRDYALVLLAPGKTLEKDLPQVFYSDDPKKVAGVARKFSSKGFATAYTRV